MRKDLQNEIRLGKLLIQNFSQDQNVIKERSDIFWEPHLFSDNASVASSSLSALPAEDESNLYSSLKACIGLLHDLSCVIQWALPRKA